MTAESVYLRALEPDDIERTLKWHNDEALYRSLGGSFRFVSHAAEEVWIKSKCGCGGGEVNLAICVSKTGRHIGNICLRDIDWIARRAELHLFIGDADRQQRGHGSSALRQLVRHAFDTLGLQRLFLHVLADNAAAVRTYEKCGFAVEGRMKRHAFKDGCFKDVLVMGLCAPAGR